MSEQMSPDQWLAHLQRKLAAQAQAAGVYRDYYDGDHRLAFATSKFREAFGSLFSAFADNWCQIVVDAAAERLTVQGFRFGPGDGGDERAWEIWQANGLDAESIKGHTEAVKCGRAYLLASPASEGTTGLPVVTVEHPSQVVLECAPGRRRDRLAALKTWTDLDGAAHATLYLPRSIHRYQAAGKGNPTWEAVDGGGANPAGVVPVVALENNPDLVTGGRSDLQPIVRMQDAINKLCSDMLVSSEYNAFRQRYATGLEIPVDEETGQPIPGADLKAGMSRLMVSADPDTRFGEFSETTLGGYIAAIRLLVTHVAAQTRTPPHYVLGEIVNAPLALDTVVPVPGGRTTIGDLRVGDQVYAPDGAAQTVTGKSPVFRGRDCYRVVFSDGAEVIADADHRWETTRFRRPDGPYRPGVGNDVHETGIVTTREIAETLKTAIGTNNHFIETASALQEEAREFPIDPYVLGVWLGDGCRHHGTITSHVADCEEMAGHLRERGERVEVRTYPQTDEIYADTRTLKIRHDRELCPRGHRRPTGTKTTHCRCPECAHLHYRRRRYGDALPAKTNASFQMRMKSLGVWRNKHIPEAYFHGSPAQRLALLQGLMDTDGTVNAVQGSVALSLHDERLARDAWRLILSLGHKAALRERKWTHKKFGEGTAWGIHWSAPDPVFRLARKATLQKTEIHPICSRRYITACDAIASVPVQCIEVSGDSHLFLLTDSLIATHNSGDALKAAETGLAYRVRRKQIDFSDPWEDVMRIAFLLDGDKQRAGQSQAEVVWRDAEARSEGEVVDALTKLRTLGVPLETVWAIYGFSPQEIARMKDLAGLPDRPPPGATTAAAAAPAVPAP